MASVLVIDDVDVSRLALVTALAPFYTVIESATVASALAALQRAAPDAVVLDLCLDADRAPLHRRLEELGVPVVLVSGEQPEQLPTIARVNGWRFAAKPVEPEELVAKVTSALERSATRRTPTLPPGTRATMAPAPPELPAPVPSVRQETPPDGSSLRPTADSRPERAQIHDAWSRRLKHMVVALCITGLTLYGQRTGHAVEWYVIAILGALGLGPGAAFDALKKRPGTTAAGLVGLAGLALLGDAAQLPELGAISALGVAALPSVDRLATLTRSPLP